VPSASALQSNLESFTSLGLEVAYTELDVRIPVPVSAADVS
jgi:endo-1,4-beta-xylanase